ncbi:MAG TPA: PstS family phosphate ABC transporter substrate-binding protein, partial [Steroidobacteraceae bacterium]|nr:PstS family phosphate ABC transporter substrate-binding protein [Steroidobacteraceae bacterium]
MIRQPSRRLARIALLAACLGTFQVAGAQVARDYISIVGSSTVFPFSTAVAETFGRSTKFKTPKVESTGTGGGLKLFCSGVGVQHPDIANASRRIKQSEVDTCRANGVTDIVEVKIGYDGIVVAHAKSAPDFDLTLKELWLALAKEVPDPAGGEKLVANPYQTWKDINPSFPADRIEVLGPPPTSGTRDAFAELALEGGCVAIDWIAALKKSDESRFKSVCMTIREDGAYIEAGENDNLIVQKLSANPKALGVFGYSFLEQNTDKLKPIRIGGVLPEYDAIASGDYPVSRSIYFYVKGAHVGVIPGLKEFVAEFTSDKAFGPEG